MLSSPVYQMPTCQAPIQQGVRKGELCGNETANIYCSKHARQAIIDMATKENKRLCDIARGCYTALEDHQSKCTHCLHKARIRDRKREDEKRQDPNCCLDCATKLTDALRAKGKHDKLLRRCVPCYEKLLKYERNRPPRERNYKVEMFTNKHVLWNHYVKGAQKRSIDFAIPKTRFYELIIKPCFYCDYKREGEVNGIDRIDNNKGYLEENLVSCCQTCNFMKGAQHPQEFLDKIKSIHSNIKCSIPIPSALVEKWGTTYLSKSIPTYKSYTKSANSRNIAFKLSEDDFSTLIKQPCYLCGITTSETNTNGIDRLNNSKGYILDNCRPCCGHCNLLKKDIEYELIIQKADAISDKYAELTTAISAKSIPIRVSKVEPRIKVEELLLTQEPVPLEYKPLNEVIVPKQEAPEYIKQLLEKKEVIPKQWKVKQIYQFIHENKECQYKLYCEENNTIQPLWEQDWKEFIISVKGKPYSDSEGIIRAFVENLRRIRHNQLYTQKVE
jgi:hypothetical protein